MKTARWLAVVGAFVALTCPAGMAAPKEPAPDPSLPEYVYYADAVLLRWVSKQIREHEMSRLPNSALVFLCGNTPDGLYREVEVRENHQPVAQLNVDTAPRLFTLRINLKTGALTTDAARFDGKVHPADGKFRLVIPGIKHPRK